MNNCTGSTPSCIRRASLLSAAYSLFALTCAAQGNLWLAPATVSSGSPVYQGTTIANQSTFVVNNSANVTFQAGNSITLMPGFDAVAGSMNPTFQALINANAINYAGTSVNRGIVTFTLSDGPHIAYIGEANHIQQAFYTISNGLWNIQNLNGALGAPNSQPQSPLALFTLSDGPHIIYIDSNQHITQLWYTVSSGVWQEQDLTSLTGAPAPESGSGLSTFDGPDGLHIFFVNTAQHLTQMWLTNSSGWLSQDLTGANLGPAANSSLTSFATDGVTPHIVFVDTSGNVAQTYWSNGQGMVVQELAGPAASGTALASWMQGDGPHIVYTDTSQHIHQVWYTISADSWNTQDLTAALSAPLAETGSPLSIFTGNDGDHVFYVESGTQHVCQLWWNTSSQWLVQDLSNGVNGAPPNSSSGLASFALSDDIPHIVFVDTNWHIDQLWWQGGMVEQDLTSTVTQTYTIEGQVTTLGSPLAGVSIALSGTESLTTSTDGSGNYSFSVAYGGSYTVTPSLSGYNFSPSSQTFNNLSSNHTAANFTATTPGAPGTDPNPTHEFIRLNGQPIAIENGH